MVIYTIANKNKILMNLLNFISTLVYLWMRWTINFHTLMKEFSWRLFFRHINKIFYS